MASEEMTLRLMNNWIFQEKKSVTKNLLLQYCELPAADLDRYVASAAATALE